MATKAIKQLSNEYSSYVDVIQPVQTAIYEIKLGLSLAFSGALNEKYLEELGKFDVESVLVLSFILLFIFDVSVFRFFSKYILTYSTMVDRLQFMPS